MGRRFRIGTSGWHYPHWRGPFYPRDLAADAWLEYYARRFDSVEINNSFYQLPSRRTLRAWCAAVPAGFRFAIKASRYITHMKKLTAPRGSLRRFLAALDALGDKRGPALFQLPPRWRCDPGRLERFLAALPDGLECAFEFRDPSWHNDEVYGLLRDRGAAFCIYDLAGFTAPRVTTAPFGYVRLHGPARAYRDRYGPARLRRWAQQLKALPAMRRAYVYFDNDAAAGAVADALALKRLLAPR
ncbi:MAG TPA: DUF72 domain-containing protein [Acidiferrobacterales bacterium]